MIQGPKIKVIDDCLQSGVNSAYTAFNKLKLMDADAFISLVLLILQAAAEPRSYLVLESGERVDVRKHHAWGEGLGLLGKTLDLASAYKQLGCRPETKFNRVLVAWSPEFQKPAFFVSTALMFGATSSVYSFNRCSASLWHILTSLGNVCCAVFFDDFPCLEPRASAESAEHFMIQCLSLLGWKVALQPKKNQPFASTFALLGVQVSLEESDAGTFTVGNKPDRLLELRAELGRLLDQGFLMRSEASAA